ncbi:hypothetical protein LCGC14_2684210, partial [marine sediment metagenome]
TDMVVSPNSTANMSAHAGIYCDDKTKGLLIQRNVIVLGWVGTAGLRPALWGYLRGYNTIGVNANTTPAREPEVVSRAGVRD